MIGGRPSRRPLDLPHTDRFRWSFGRSLAAVLGEVRDAASTRTQRLGRSVVFQVLLLVVLAVCVTTFLRTGLRDAAFLTVGLFVAVQVSLLAVVLLGERHETAKTSAARATADREAAERTSAELAYIMRELSEIRSHLGKTATRSFVQDQNDELLRRLEHVPVTLRAGENA